MIDFYRTWKDDKESNSKPKKSRGAFKCIVCGKRTNGLKSHMDDTHGPGTYQKYIEAQKIIEERKRQEILELMGGM